MTATMCDGCASSHGRGSWAGFGDKSGPNAKATTGRNAAAGFCRCRVRRGDPPIGSQCRRGYAVSAPGAQRRRGFKVTKNRLARRALVGTAFEPLSPLFAGPTAIAFSRDPVVAAKVVVEFANRNNKLTIVGGGLAGQQMDVAGVRELASLPSLDELRAKLVGLLQTPGTRLAVVLQATAGQIARVVAAHAEQRAEAA